MHRFVTRALVPTLCLCSVLSLTGCDDDDDSTTTSSTSTSTASTSSTTTTDINIPFTAQVNGTPFTCGTTFQGVGNAVTDRYRIDDFRFYINNIRLKDHYDGKLYPVELKQDGKWQYNNMALLDFENGCVNGTKELNTQVTATLPAGKNISDFNGICFVVGLPFTENHADPASAPAPINVSGMLWSWTTGRKFIRVDGVGDPDGLKTSFHVHLGSTGCSDVNKQGKQPDGPCTYANTPEICLNNFVLNQHTIIADIGKILRNSNVAYNTPNSAAGCMAGNSDPECQPIFPLLGLDFIYNDGANPAITFPKQEQVFFGLK